MKKLLIILVIILALIIGSAIGFFVLAAKAFKQVKQSDAFVKTTTTIDKMVDVAEQFESGKISEDAKNEILGQLTGEMPKNDSSVKEAGSMPKWVKSMGIDEPKGLKLVKNESTYTEKNASGEGFDSVNLVYSGNIKTIKTEADKIGSKLGLKKLPTGENTYNYVPNLMSDSEYITNVSITDDSSGSKLIISVSQKNQMKYVLKKHIYSTRKK